MKLIMVAGGVIQPELLSGFCREAGEEMKIMGIDGGVLAVERAGAVPDLVIGDFDSVPTEERERILNTYRQQRVLNPVKDDTDLEAAVRWAVRLHPEEVVLLGAMGDRMDHTLTNLRLMVLFAEAGIPAVMQDHCNRVRILTGSVKIRKEQLYGPYISLLPAAGPVKGITLRGFRYPLTDGVLEPFSSLGISNELTEQEGEILYQEGLLFMMETKDRAE